MKERLRSLVYNVGTNDMPDDWRAKVEIDNGLTEEDKRDLAVQTALINDLLLSADGDTLSPSHAEISALINEDPTVDCPFYESWKGMVQTCYDPYWLNDNPTDRDATVSEEWKTFSTFKQWMETQDWEGKVLAFREPTSMIA
jgi:hypothetical protein